MSNTSAFKGKKIAVMVASGFNEEQFLIIQKTILAAEGSYTIICLLYTSPSPRDGLLSRMPSSA